MSYRSIDPNTGKTLEGFEHPSSAQLEYSLAAADNCFKTRKHASHAERAVVPNKAAAPMHAHGDDFAKLATLEIGKRIDRPGSFVQTTILTDIAPKNPAFRDEFFGPVVSFFRVNDEAAAVDTGTMFIDNIDWSDAEPPFGGIEDSGYGRELGTMGIQAFVNKKLVRTADVAAPVIG